MSMTRYQAVARRSFFASSTDHSRLLAESKVHRLISGDSKQYVMAADGMDLETVQKVPQLHLARLNLKSDGTMYGAKVINRTLGSPEEVCGKLVDVARKDGGIRARSHLHGLSEWVLNGLRNETTIPILQEEDDEVLQDIEKIASGQVTYSDPIYQANKDRWERLAQEFVKLGLGGEAALYQSKGASLSSIEHGTDDSEYADTSAGVMALFTFE